MNDLRIIIHARFFQLRHIIVGISIHDLHHQLPPGYGIIDQQRFLQRDHPVFHRVFLHDDAAVYLIVDLQFFDTDFLIDLTFPAAAKFQYHRTGHPPHRNQTDQGHEGFIRFQNRKTHKDIDQNA